MSPVLFLLYFRLNLIPAQLVTDWAARHKQNPIDEARRLWEKIRPRYAGALACFLFAACIDIGLYYWGSIESAISVFTYAIGNAGPVTLACGLSITTGITYDFRTNGFGKDIKVLLKELGTSVWTLRKQSLPDLATNLIIDKARKALLVQREEKESPPIFPSSEKEIAMNMLKHVYDACAAFKLNKWQGYARYFKEVQLT